MGDDRLAGGGVHAPARLPRDASFHALDRASVDSDRAGESADKEVMASRFLGPNGDDQTVIVVNRSKDAQDVEVPSLRKRRTYHLADWNRDAKGGLLPLDAMTTGDGGKLTVRGPAPRRRRAVDTADCADLTATEEPPQFE